MSQGPLIPGPENVSTAWPLLSSTMRQPDCAVVAVPSLVGRLPTMTHPERNATNAVVSPIPPGHGPGSDAALRFANGITLPFALISTIVLPVPWRFDALLKLLTRTLSLISAPTLTGMVVTPYGFTSPLPGTVDATVVM